MKLFSIQAYYFVLLLNCIFVSQAKIVYINGTEIADDNPKNVNETTPEPVTKWFSVFNPKNISNHSGNSKRSDLHPPDSKNEEKQQAENDEKEQTENILDDENYQSFNDTLATRDATLLSTLRGIFDGLTPMVTILSTIIGLFIIFVLIQSPLSPLPVPPLPYPPIGPFPPTNIYPFGVPPHHPGIPYSVRYNGPTRYAGPSVHAGTLYGGYRIPRNFKVENEKSIFNDMLQKVIESVAASNSTTMEEKLVDFFIPVIAEICMSLDGKTSHLRQKIGDKNDVEETEREKNIIEEIQEEKTVIDENKEKKTAVLTTDDEKLKEKPKQYSYNTN